MLPSTVIEEFKLVKTKADLCGFLEVSEAELNKILYGYKSAQRYLRYEIKKRNGGTRVIHAPIRRLKVIQKKLATCLLALYEAQAGTHGYVRGRSISTNARNHTSKRWVLSLDLKDFFPSINFGRVRGLFLKSPFDFPDDVATILAQICIVDNQLPQGAPTSPILSNFICRKLDARLLHFAQKAHCSYTRYADDICLSGTSKSPSRAVCAVDSSGQVTLSETLIQIIEKNGFEINKLKTRLVGYSSRQMVTGLIVNQFANVSRSYVRNIRLILRTWEKYGEDAATNQLFSHNKKYYPPGKSSPSFKAVLRGRILYLRQIRGKNDPLFLRLGSRLAALDPTFKPQAGTYSLSSNPQKRRILLFAEGKTDYLHIESALKFFQRAGYFTSLEIDFKKESDISGDDDLLRYCKSISKADVSDLHLCVFDRDKLETTKKVTDGQTPYKKWAPNVYSLAIPNPDGDEPFCIEMYYPLEVIHLRKEGRRIFLDSEFHKKTRRHLVEPCYTTNKKDTLIIDDEVFHTETSDSLAMSKSSFADLIFTSTPPFDSVNFERFRILFETIELIAKEYIGG